MRAEQSHQRGRATCFRATGDAFKFLGKAKWAAVEKNWIICILYIYIYIFFFLNKFCETEAVSEWAQQCGAEDGFFGPEADVWGCGVVFFCILTGLACLDMAGASGVEDVSHGGILPDKMTRGCRVWRWTARGYTWFMVELISNFA